MSLVFSCWTTLEEDRHTYEILRRGQVLCLFSNKDLSPILVPYKHMFKDQKEGTLDVYSRLFAPQDRRLWVLKSLLADTDLEPFLKDKFKDHLSTIYMALYRAPICFDPDLE